jgi:hypothetical protein
MDDDQLLSDLLDAWNPELVRCYDTAVKSGMIHNRLRLQGTGRLGLLAFPCHARPLVQHPQLPRHRRGPWRHRPRRHQQRHRRKTLATATPRSRLTPVHGLRESWLRPRSSLDPSRRSLTCGFAVSDFSSCALGATVGWLVWPYVRTVRTTSGSTAVQIVHSSRRGRGLSSTSARLMTMWSLSC